MKGFKKILNIPFELQVEIIKRVPVKSLLQFRSVSKQWKSLIDSSQFINDHSVNQTQPQRLLITYSLDSEVKSVSIVDNDSFPHHKFSHPTVKLVSYSLMLGCSHGLVLCLHGVSEDPENRQKLVVVWNPSIRRSVGVVLPHGSDPLDIFGFGVYPKTNDPKIVKITRSRVDGAINCKANLFTFSSRAWRSIPMKFRRPLKSNIFAHNPVVIDGIIHWFVYRDFMGNNIECDGNRIISFDLTSEEFGEVDLPDCLAGPGYMEISKLKDSLVVLAGCEVWMVLKNGVPKSSFTKLFTVNAFMDYSIIGFRKNGQLIVHRMGLHDHSELEVCEPDSEHKNGLGIYGSVFHMASYTESLLLLNHYDSIIQ